jgi:4-aminobutyrate aminotransferase/(S)-3-amino-2-methylpropionate transaminase
MPIGTIRGRGAMVPFELLTERNGLVPDAVKAKAVTVRALEEGLILLTCGNHANSVRILALLTISDQVLSEGLDRLGRALTIRA